MTPTAMTWAEPTQLCLSVRLGYEACPGRELMEVVRLLEQGGLDLDASLRLWGRERSPRCEGTAGARRRVSDIAGDGAQQLRQGYASPHG